MTLSADSKFWHDRYEATYQNVHEAVDEAYTAVRKVIESRSMIAANDDRAETLVAAIMQYISTSGRTL